MSTRTRFEKESKGNSEMAYSQLTEPFYNCILTSVLKPFLNCIEHTLFHYTIPHNNTLALVFTLYHFTNYHSTIWV